MSLLLHLFTAIQAAPVESLPDVSPTHAVAPVPGSGLNLFSLVWHASLPVQLVMAMLLVASVASWVIIFRKQRVLGGAENRRTVSRNGSGRAWT